MQDDTSPVEQVHDLLGRPTFSPAETLLLGELHAQLSGRVAPHERCCLLLLIASEFIDTTAEILAHTHPGLKVVEITLLAELVAQLAQKFETALPPDASAVRSF